MKREMTSQVKEAIRKLKNSGFKRSDYSVRVERLSDGCYGDAKICLKMISKETGKYLARMLKEGLSVTVALHDNGFHLSVNDNYIQKLLFVRVSKDNVNFQLENCLRPEYIKYN